jgi:hypothetical protein
MRRLFWMGVGAAGAIVVVQRVRRAAERLTPDGIAEQVVAAGRRTTSALREAVSEFRVATSTREAELVNALLVEPEAGTVEELRAARAASRRTDRPVDDPLDDDGEDDFF